MTSTSRTPASLLCAATAALLVAAVGAAPAAAGGFHMAKFGGDLGYPTSTNAVAVFWNPGALAHAPGTDILLESTLYWRRIDYERRDPGVADPRNVGTGRLRNVVAVPFIGARSDFGLDVVHFGVAAYPAFGMSTYWEDEDGPQRWHSIVGNLSAWYLTGAAGVKLPFGVSVGASVSWVRTTIETLRATSLDIGLDPTGGLAVHATDDPANEGRTVVDVADDGVAWSFGVFWAPLPALHVGLSYQSRVRADATGRVRQADPRGTVTRSAARFTSTLPDALHVAVEVFPSERLGLRLGVSWVNWSLFNEQVLTVEDALGEGSDVRLVIPRRYHDSYIVRGGAKYRFLDWLTVYVGLGWDQSPVPARTLEGSLFDLDKIGLSAGAVFDPWEHLRLTVGYNHIFYLSADVRGSEQEPSANGHYEAAVDVFQASAELRF